MFLDNPVLARAKGAEVVKQKLGILQRLMMKLQGCWLSLELLIIDFV
jgi:hypothetical protein